MTDTLHGHAPPGRNGVKAGLTPRRRVQTEEFPAFMSRLLRAWARRVGEADTYDLAELAAFQRDVERAIGEAVRDGRARETGAWSWAEIGDALGVSRQAAQQRWGDTANSDEESS